MTLSLVGKNIAILIAGGFDENQMTEVQRALVKLKANIQTLAPEQGVVNGWQGTGWGHYFPVDAQINEALGSDFDMLVLPGGTRGYAKLKANLHARRIINHFMDAQKPIATIGSGTGLLALSSRVLGHLVSSSEDVKEDLKAAGATISDNAMEMETHLLTSDGSDVGAWVEQVIAFFGETEEVSEAA